MANSLSGFQIVASNGLVNGEGIAPPNITANLSAYQTFAPVANFSNIYATSNTLPFGLTLTNANLLQSIGANSFPHVFGQVPNDFSSNLGSGPLFSIAPARTTAWFGNSSTANVYLQILGQAQNYAATAQAVVASAASTPVSYTHLHNLLREHFDYELPVGNLTVEKAQIVLEEICIRIDNFRKSNDYYLGERNARYLSMLATANFLTEFLKDKAVLVEALPTNSSAYHAGMGKGIAHGVDTAGSFVPHVAGSAIGAFMGGLKGQALQSDAGRVKIANVDLENDMKGLNPKNPAQVKDFFQKQLKKHFSEYDTVQQGNILTYMTGIYQAGVDNKNTSENDIAAGLKTIPGLSLIHI